MRDDTRLAAFRAAPRARRVFLVTYGGGHVTKVAAVVRELQARGYSCLVMALTIGFAKARQLGLDPVGYRDFAWLAGEEEVLRRGRQLLAGNRHPDVDEDESCCYLGVNYLEWVQAEGEAAAEARYRGAGRQGFLPVRFFRQVLAHLEPGIVVATSSPRSEQAAIEAAVALGVPTLTMVDLFAPPSDPFLRRPVQAQCVTVVSQEVRENFLAAGLEPWRVVVTGSPDFDALFEPAAAAEGTARRHGLGTGIRQVVLWAGYREPEGAGVPAEYAGVALGVAVEGKLRAWVASRRDAALLVRYHPSHYPDFPDAGPQERVVVSHPGREPIGPLLHAADTVVCQASTVCFEAALLRRRVLRLQFAPSVRRADFDLDSLGPTEPVESLGGLITALDGPARPVARRKMTVPEGPAAPRVADEVVRLISSNT